MYHGSLIVLSSVKAIANFKKWNELIECSFEMYHRSLIVLSSVKAIAIFFKWNELIECSFEMYHGSLSCHLRKQLQILKNELN